MKKLKKNQYGKYLMDVLEGNIEICTRKKRG